jgi:hypothetical protein
MNWKSLSIATVIGGLIGIGGAIISDVVADVITNEIDPQTQVYTIEQFERIDNRLKKIEFDLSEILKSLNHEKSK